MHSYLVTGARGQLGQCFKAIAKEFPKFKLIFADQKAVDISRLETLQNSFNKQPFEGIINCAAYTKVDHSEENPEMAYSINTEGIQNLIAFAEAKALSIVHFSTDYVFDGTNSTPYQEEHKPNPVNTYGKSKYEGEQLLVKAKCLNTTFRISWLFSPFGNNFVKNILRLSQKKDSLIVIDDQWGRPTYGINLARNVMTNMLEPHFFEYHCYNFALQGPTTWFDFASKILSFKNSSCKLQSCSTAEYPHKAKRPLYTVLDTTRIEKHLSLDVLTWETALKDCFNRMQI